MNSKLRLSAVLLAGVAIGLAAAAAIHAQQTKTAPGYIVAEIDVKDLPMFQKYVAGVPATMVPYNGQFLARAGKIVPLEGPAPKRFTIIAFDSVAKAQAWEDSPAYSAIKGLRQNSTDSRIFIAEGIPPQ